MAQDCPKMAHDGPKMGPRWLQLLPGKAQKHKKYDIFASWRSCGLSWTIVGPSWGILGHLGLILASSGRSWALFGAILAPPWATSSVPSPFRGALKPREIQCFCVLALLRVILDDHGAILGSLGTILGPSWRNLGLVLASSGRSWAVFGAILVSSWVPDGRPDPQNHCFFFEKC